MNNRDDADSTPDDGEPTAPPAQGAQTPDVPDNAGSDEFSTDTDQFPPVERGTPAEAYSQGRQDTAQLEVPPDGFEPYAAQGPTPQPAGDQVPPAVAPQRPKRRTGMIAGLVALGLVLVLVIAGVGSELYIRNKAQDCLEQSFGELTGASTSVSLSKRPMLLQWASGTVPYVQVDTSDEGDSSMRLHARGDDIQGGDNKTTIGELQGSGYVPFSRIMELAQPTESTSSQTTPDSGSDGLGGLLNALGGGMKVESVTGDAAAGTIKIATSFQFIFSLPAEVELKPVVAGNSDVGESGLSFEVVSASAVGFGVPADWAQVMVDQISAGLFPPLFDDLTFNEMKVTDKGIDFAVEGSDLVLDEQTLGSNSSESSSTCSVL